MGPLPSAHPIPPAGVALVDQPTFFRVRQILVDQFRRRDDLTAASHLVDNLGLDSLDLAELQMALEIDFDVPIPDAVAGNWSTVGDVVEWLADDHRQAD